MACVGAAAPTQGMFLEVMYRLEVMDAWSLDPPTIRQAQGRSMDMDGSPLRMLQTCSLLQKQANDASRKEVACVR